MTRSGRAFGVVLGVASASAAVLALPVVVTLFPEVMRRAVHDDGLLRACAAALYAIGRDLPPLGAFVLSGAAAGIAAAAWRAGVMIRGAERLAARHVTVPVRGELARAAAGLGLDRRVVCFSSRTPAAYTAGLITPSIWISSAAARTLARDELDAVLRHEREHLRCRDPLRLVLMRTLAAALWPVPLVSELVRRFELATELDADRAALAGPGGVAAVAGALATLGDARPRRSALACWSMATARVDQLFGEDPFRGAPGPLRAFASSLAVLVLVLAVTAAQAARAGAVPAMMLPAGEADVCPDQPDGPLL